MRNRPNRWNPVQLRVKLRDLKTQIADTVIPWEVSGTRESNLPRVGISVVHASAPDSQETR